MILATAHWYLSLQLNLSELEVEDQKTRFIIENSISDQGKKKWKTDDFSPAKIISFVLIFRTSLLAKVHAHPVYQRALFVFVSCFACVMGMLYVTM